MKVTLDVPSLDKAYELNFLIEAVRDISRFVEMNKQWTAKKRRAQRQEIAEMTDKEFSHFVFQIGRLAQFAWPIQGLRITSVGDGETSP